MDISIARSSGLHDFELVGIHVDYSNSEIAITVRPPWKDQQVATVLAVRGFQFFSITRELPWGEGIYIHASDLTPLPDNQYQLDMQLNSGDQIICRYMDQSYESNGDLI